MTESATLLQRIESGRAILLDGATGTHLHKAGLPSGITPELWVLDHPEVLQQLQQKYLQSGSEILYAFTFGANRVKLAGLCSDDSSVLTLNRQLAALSVQVRDEYKRNHPDCMVWVAGDLAPTGLFLQPAGDLSFNSLIDIYRQQVQGQLAAGVDLFVIETMMDLAQVRAAILAIRSLTDLPILASMTVAENGRTLSGNTPLASLITCAALGVTAFGLNCSFGPEKLTQLMEPLLPVSPVPLLMKPNAGLPRLINGQTVFPMDADAFAAAMQRTLSAGIQLVGGCCGSGPDHIAALKQLTVADERSARPAVTDCGRWICSGRSCVQWQAEDPLPVVCPDDPDQLIDEIMDVADDGPAILIDCTRLPEDVQWSDLLQELQMMTSVPLVFRCHQAQTIEALLHGYHGRAGLQTSIEPESMIHSYGALIDPVAARGRG